MALTVTEAFSVQSPNGNSLAVFIEAQSGEIKLKDVNGKVESLSDYFTESPYRYNATASTSIEPILGSNCSLGQYSTIAGGFLNTNSGNRSFVGNGSRNSSTSCCSFIGSGYKNTLSARLSFVGGGCCNIACTTASGSFIGGGYQNIASQLLSVVVGGAGNKSCGDLSFVGGGGGNTASASTSVVSGGNTNSATCQFAFVGSGVNNTASGYASSISGGRINVSSAYAAVIGGGLRNTASSCFSAIVGGRCNNTSTFADAMIVGSCLTATQACTTFVNCLSANNLTPNCYVKVGTNKVLENSPFAPSTKSVGSFFDTTTQSALLINSPTKMTLNTTDISNNVSVVGGTAITVANAGIYNLQFSAQLFRAAGGTTKTIDIWLRKNGTNVPSSDTVMVFSNNTTFQVAAWNFVVDLAAGGSVELMYSVEDLDIKIQSAPENLVVPHPAVPSLIVTMIEV